MGVVVQAKIQRVEDIYRLIREAVTGPKPALYDGRARVLGPHRLGRNSAGQKRVLYYHIKGNRWIRRGLTQSARQRHLPAFVLLADLVQARTEKSAHCHRTQAT